MEQETNQIIQPEKDDEESVVYFDKNVKRRAVEKEKIDVSDKTLKRIFNRTRLRENRSTNHAGDQRVPVNKRKGSK